MFDLNFRQYDPYAQVMGGPGQGRWGHDALLMVAACECFDKARRRAQSRQLLARLLRRPRALLDLNNVHCGMAERHYCGLQTVDISSIRGSEGRCHDFDRDFLPLTPELAQRWTSVFVAIQQGIAMPPVQLIRVGDIYFVRDGHHRISVARIRGCEQIEAEVIVWNTSLDSPPVTAPVAVHNTGYTPRLRREDDPVAIA